MDRVKTNIKGFDELIEGGFPKGSNIMLLGGAGTGKTIFSMQFLYEGVMSYKENGIYFSFEEKKENLFKQAKQFGWDLEKLEKKGKIKIISLGLEELEKSTIEDIFEIIKNNKVKRVVIDSITTLSYLSPLNNNEFSVKKYIYSFISKFNQISDLTSIFISQEEENFSNSVAKYICDGIVNIKSQSFGGNFSRSIKVLKMRRTKNIEDTCPMEINNSGIEIHKL